MSTPLMNTYARQPVAFVRGEGAWLWDEHGKAYLDAISGVAVTNLGHSHPEVVKAVNEQSACLMHTSNLFEIPWQRKLAEKLARISGLDAAFFCNSGAEANETALKLAWLHGKQKGLHRPKFLVMETSFHGRTFATMAATGNPAVCKGFEPLMEGFVRVPFNDIESVEHAALSEPGICAVLIEPVQGEGGVHVADVAYLRALRDFCNRQGWLLMVDEIQSGMARSGKWLAVQHADVLPDVVTLAKGLANGFPIGACLATDKVAALFGPGTHGSTFGGNPMACRAACAVLDVMTKEDACGRARMLGARLMNGLRRELSHHPGVAALRGCGLLVGVEMKFPCTALMADALQREALLVSVTRERVVRILPPLICTEAEIDEIVVRLVRSMERMTPPFRHQEFSRG